jgi:hypothetical protein
LPIHLVVQVLERNILDVPAGQPAFADPRYSSFALNSDYFYPLPKLRGKRKISFVDGGSTEIIGAPNFAVGLTRLYFCVFEGDRRIEAVNVPQRIDFYTVCYAVPRGNQIAYKTELVPVKEEWRKYLPDVTDLELDSLDRTIMLGPHRAPISRVLEVARVFAEWRFSSFIVQQELEEGDVVVRDGTLQTTVTNEGKYADEAYGAALQKKAYFAGLSKTSTLFTETGQPLFSAIHVLSESSRMKDDAWYYYPIATITQPDHKAEMLAVKLHKQSEYVFRFEILKDQVSKNNFGEVELIIAALAANSKDVGFPGYPYGLIDADKFARVSMTEKTVNEFQFRAAIPQKVWEKISMFVKSSDAHDMLNKLIR